MNINVSTIQRQANVAIIELDINTVAHIVRDIDALKNIVSSTKRTTTDENGKETVSFCKYDMKDEAWTSFCETSFQFFVALQDAVLAD